MTITVFRYIHVPGELNEKFDKLLKKSDALFFECASSDYADVYKQSFEELSFKGYATFVWQDAMFPEADDEIANHIRSSHKKILIERSPYTREQMLESIRLNDDAFLDFANGNLEGAVEKYTDARRYSVCTNSSRDYKMALDLAVADRRFNVTLALVGTNHHVDHFLHQLNPSLDVVVQFPSNPYFLGISGQLNQRAFFHKPISKEFVAGALAGEYVYQILASMQDISEQQKVLKANDIAGKLSWDEIDDLSRHVAHAGLRFRYEAAYIWFNKKGLL